MKKKKDIPYPKSSVLKSGCRTGKKTGTGPNWTDGNRSTVAISGPVEFGSGCGCLDLENIKDRSKTGCDQLQPVFEQIHIIISTYLSTCSTYILFISLIQMNEQNDENFL
jgi:hypothetical protein